jgi:TRAP-type C4-dicarboxylate transport system substrate-binding protein
VDGAALPWTITRPIRLHEVTDYHTVLDFYAVVFGMVMNKSRWESLPADMQQAINDASSEEFVRELGELWDGDEAQGRQMAIDAGNEIIEVSDSERERFREACQPVIDNWIETVNERGMDGQALYEEALSLIEAQSA